MPIPLNEPYLSMTRIRYKGYTIMLDDRCGSTRHIVCDLRGTYDPKIHIEYPGFLCIRTSYDKCVEFIERTLANLKLLATCP